MRSVTIISFVLYLIFISCSRHDYEFPKDSLVDDVASIVILGPDSSIVFLHDYFPDPTLIDSVDSSPYYCALFNDDRSEIQIDVNVSIPAYTTLRLWADGFSYDIPMRKSLKKEHILVFDPDGIEYSSVAVAGSFNGWTSSSGLMSFEEGLWKISLKLDPGKFQYRLIVDDKWMLDPANPDSIDNNYDGFNSVLLIEGDDVNKIPFIYSSAYNEEQIVISIENEIENIIVLWQNHRLSDLYYSFPEPQKLLIKVPGKAADMERSYIRIYSWNESGISNDLMIPLAYGNPIITPGEVKRSDKHSLIMYFMMVDRFNNGKPGNDYSYDNPDVLPKAEYYGGDIAGITQKIRDGFFKDLGVNTIWLSPIVQNPEGAYGEFPDPYTKFTAYHGYWPISFTKVEPRFGTPGELKELVNTAHENNINVLLDFVANHVHEEHPLYKENPGLATDLYLPDGSLNTERWDEYRLTTWFDIFLPTLDLTSPEVSDMLTDSAVFWLNEYNIDGFRHDATKHIPLLFWRMLTSKIKEKVTRPGGRMIYQVGETYGSRELIGSYIGSGMLDGQFDFDIYHDGLNVLAKEEESMQRLEYSLRESLRNYGSHHLMGNISGNQDKPRFTSLAGGDLTFEEDSKYAGWTRDIGVGDPLGYKKMMLMHALNMTIPGIPVIYYGDEFGMPGGNDPDNRRMMQFGNLNPYEIKTRETVQKLVNSRRNYLSLIYGATKTLYIDDNTWVFARMYFGEIAIVVLNKGPEAASVEIEIPSAYHSAEFQSNFGGEYKINGGKMQITISGLAFDIITTSMN